MGFFNRNTGPVDFLVVGLGNPGKEYEKTRHNVGYLALEELAEGVNIPVQRLKHRALTGTATIGGQKVLLMKPVTYMNLSGQSVGEAARFYKIPPERILVITDDVALPVGKIRLRRKGSAGGHNGLKSLIQHLGTDEFLRIKIGVGDKPHPDYEMADWVLGKFAPQDEKAVKESIERAAQAARLILAQGMEAAMSAYNG